MLLAGDEMGRTQRGNNNAYCQDNDTSWEGDTLFVMFSAHPEPIRFVLPRHEPGQHWERMLDTSLADWSCRLTMDGADYQLAGRSVVVFRIVAAAREEA
jgi:pullulanase/glycogen debranching enzyme